MTTKEAIKALIVADYELSYVIGYTAHMKEFDTNVFDALVNARHKFEEVVFALCDELPDHFADPGKKVLEERREERRPCVIVPEDKKYPSICLNCGGNALKVADDCYYCQKCEEFIGNKPKNEEGAK